MLQRNNNNILVLAPHPDDEVVGTCTIIKRGIKQGKSFYIFFLTNGVITKKEMWFFLRKKHKENVKIRLNEMHKAVNSLGIKNFFLQDIPSRTLKENISTTLDKINSILKKLKIDTIMTPAYEGGHQDHDVANFIASKFIDKLDVYEFAEYNNFNKLSVCNTFIKKYGNEIKIILNDQEIYYKKKILNIYKSESRNLGHIDCKKELYRKLIDYNYFERPHNGILFYERFKLFSWHPRVDGTSPELICKILKNYKN